MKTVVLAAALLLSSAAANAALAQTAPTSAAAPGVMSSQTTTVGELIDKPASKAILDKDIPGLSSNPQIDAARGMTLAAIQPYASDQITDEVLKKVDADLAKLPPKK